MKIGWLVWESDADKYPVLIDREPDFCFKCVRIVYTEIKD